MQDLNTGDGGAYGIGAVSRLTGLPEHTLRAWERRYGAVQPERKPGGGRRYSKDDINRLVLIKRLTEMGHPVSTVATLPLAELQERASATLPQAEGMEETTAPCRLAVLGHVLPSRLQAAADTLEDVELVGVSGDEDHFAREAAGWNPETIALERATVNEETAAEVLELLEQTGAQRALVVYAFGLRAAVQRLNTSRIIPLRGPVEVTELARLCRGARSPATGPAGDIVEEMMQRPLPERRYEAATLAQLASMSPAMGCECPNHLADLISGLAAFERYSTECESRSPEDAALHAMLHAVTAQARSMMEEALARVVDAEDLALPEEPPPDTD